MRKTGKIAKLIKLNEKFQSKSLNMHDNVRGLRLFMRELIIAAMLNPAIKSRFMQEFSRFVGFQQI